MSDWEAVIEAAAELESAVGSFADDRRWRTRDAPEAIIARFECCRVDDLPTRTVAALASAWLQALDLEDDRLRALMESNEDA